MNASAETYVGAYRLLRLINQGGQGSVYLGYDKRLQRKVAIKIYRLPSARKARRGLLREAQLVAAMHSPKIVQVYDVIESDSHLAMVMEYVPGCDLEQFLAQTHPSLASIVTLGTDIASALAVARQEQIVHGDLKASNVLVTDQGRAKLTDFGIAQSGREARAMQSLGGSVSALAPEHFSSEPVGEQADLFALGVLLYRLVSAQHPFYRNAKLDVKLLCDQDPTPLQQLVSADATLPDSLVDLINQLLQKDPAARPSNTRGVRRVLREIFPWSTCVS